MFVSVGGVVGEEEGLPHTDGGPLHVHRGREVPSVPGGGDGHVDAADQVRPGSRPRPVRVPGQHGAKTESRGHPKRRW